MRWIGASALVVLGLVTGARAHRLDEYLQATLIGVTRDGVDVEIRLTPGVAMLPAWMSVVDGDRDGRISAEEERAYADRVGREVSLEVDGVAVPLRLVSSEFPAMETMRDGLGTVAVKLHAESRGRRVRFENHHLPQLSVYLVNCLAAPGLSVGRQVRDEAQKSIAFEYSFGGADWKWAGMWLAGAMGLVLAIRMVWVRR
jgi:hypothetical protein